MTAIHENLWKDNDWSVLSYPYKRERVTSDDQASDDRKGTRETISVRDCENFRILDEKSVHSQEKHAAQLFMKVYYK